MRLYPRAATTCAVDEGDGQHATMMALPVLTPGIRLKGGEVKIHVANAYSGHADGEQMVQWLSVMNPPDIAYAVHGNRTLRGPDSATGRRARVERRRPRHLDECASDRPFSSAQGEPRPNVPARGDSRHCPIGPFVEGWKPTGSETTWSTRRTCLSS